MSYHSADLTHKQPQAGIGMSHQLCPIDHKGSTTGAEYRRSVGYVRCAVCHAARRGAP